VGGCGFDRRFVEGDVGVILLVDVEIFNQPLMQEPVKGDFTLLQGLQTRISVDILQRTGIRLISTSMCSVLTLGLPPSTMTIGRQILPPSLAT
jgi:hypothetical protein